MVKTILAGSVILFSDEGKIGYRSLLSKVERIRGDRCGSWRAWRDTSTALSIVSRNVRKEDATNAKKKLREIFTNIEMTLEKALVGGLAALKLNGCMIE